MAIVKPASEWEFIDLVNRTAKMFPYWTMEQTLDYLEMIIRLQREKMMKDGT
jgi:hypothetical protein